MQLNLSSECSGGHWPSGMVSIRMDSQMPGSLLLCPVCNYRESAPWFCKGTHNVAEETAKRFVLSLSDLKEHIFTDGI